MPTRQAYFEKSFVAALRSPNVTGVISDAIISNNTKKLAGKYTYYNTNISVLEAKIKSLKLTYDNSMRVPLLADEKINFKHN